MGFLRMIGTGCTDFKASLVPYADFAKTRPFVPAGFAGDGRLPAEIAWRAADYGKFYLFLIYFLFRTVFEQQDACPDPDRPG
ncbi:hypothetical protein FHW79_001515 [Azospirillum sp. OGB3]|uniref:hypothetical protein n=1 Tax=Azospirillum sp. OGB3 TaxID=2587012 RepID=UPI0016056126|nr:hypothetical protein [Azospirillum sp. OGB3]MBB3263900.1 hypothetical protein [Azospirillum sp. OGB3]